MKLARLKKALCRPLLGSGTPKRRRQERGVALIMVISSIAILTAVAVDFQFNATVDLQLAANARDELRAEYLARSGVNLSRLMLRFQKQLDGQSGMLGQLTQALGGGAGGGAGGLNLRLWETIPVDCGFFQMLLGGGGGAAGEGALAAPAFGEEAGALGKLGLKGEMAAPTNFGDFEGCFQGAIEDEEQKINVNRLNMGSVTGHAPMMQALTLLGDPRFEFIFEKPDANGVKMTPQEVLIALHDWIDERDTQASLNVTGTGEPFPDGFGDENRNYTGTYQHRYRSKNASFDSLDELYQVDGVSDLFMSAFRDRLTVFPDKNNKLNINTNDPLQQLMNIYAVAQNPHDPKLRNPIVIEGIVQEINLRRLMMPFLGMSATEFVSIIEKNGIAVIPEAKQPGNQNKIIGDKSETFTIKATGQAGKVERTLTVAVSFRDQQNPLGKVLYFREE